MRSISLLAVLISTGQCHDKQQQQQQQPIGLRNLEQPLIGFGTWNLKESAENTSSAVTIALESGYRQIDAAAAYGNEKHVGKGIADGLKSAGLRREEIWVTSKLWNDHHAPIRVEAGFNQTLSDLGLSYLDLYLMHWPVGKGPEDSRYHYDYVEAWTGMIALQKTGRARNIGVSNFSPRQIQRLVARTGVKPAVHQMELHPYLAQTKWVRWHQSRGIAVTAYSPLGNTNPTYGDRARRSPAVRSAAPLLLENPVVTDIAAKRSCSPAQVVLAWGISRGTSVIPKSKHRAYIEENVGATVCVLEKDDFARIGTLGEDPVRFNNPSQGWGVELFEGLDGV